MTKKQKKVLTHKRIYSMLRKQPGLTTVELHEAMPDLSFTAVASAISGMVSRGEAEPFGLRTVQRDGKRRKTCKGYRVRYKTKKVDEAPKVLPPVVVNTVRPVVTPPITPVPVSPVSDPSRKAFEHLAKMNSEIMRELLEVKRTLAEAEKAHDCWWCRLKKVFG